MRWNSHLISASSRGAIALPLVLFLAGAAGAQGIELDETGQPTAEQVSEPEASKPAEQVSEPAASKPATAVEDTKPAEKATASAAPKQPPKPWTVRCSKATTDRPSTCQMSQVLGNTQTGKPVFSVSIRKQEKGQMSMVLSLPHGLHLPGGVSYQVDSGQKKNLPIQASDDKGVYAVVPVDDALVAAMKRGSTFKVGVVGLNRKPVAIPVTLSGFSAAAVELAAAK